MTDVLFNRRQQMDAMLKAREARLSKTYPVRLPSFSEEIGEDVIVNVRRFQIGENVAYFGAPASLSNKIAERTPEYISLLAQYGAINEQGEVDAESIGLKIAGALYHPTFKAMVDAVVLASMVDPVVVETEEEAAQNPDAWLLDNLDYADRMAIFNGAQSPELTGGEGNSLKEFRQEAGADVADIAAVRTAKKAKRGTGTQRSRVVSA